jgi:uncharacterized cupin superfamily protein
VVEEAKLAKTEHGLVPEGEGWFVLNARDARWFRNEKFGSATVFEGDARFPQVGLNVSVLDPGQPNCMYHGEEGQEDFLVLSGECLLLVEGQERRLRAWDFVHCPPWTKHVFVGAGDGPCAILMVGTRVPESEDILYPVEPVALERGAGVESETDAPEEAYAPFPRPQPDRYRDGDLPA